MGLIHKPGQIGLICSRNHLLKPSFSPLHKFIRWSPVSLNQMALTLWCSIFAFSNLPAKWVGSRPCPTPFPRYWCQWLGILGSTCDWTLHLNHLTLVKRGPAHPTSFFLMYFYWFQIEGEISIMRIIDQLTPACPLIKPGALQWRQTGQGSSRQSLFQRREGGEKPMGCLCSPPWGDWASSPGRVKQPGATLAGQPNS